MPYSLGDINEGSFLDRLPTVADNGRSIALLNPQYFIFALVPMHADAAPGIELLSSDREPGTAGPRIGLDHNLTAGPLKNLSFIGLQDVRRGSLSSRAGLSPYSGRRLAPISGGS
jgi:hypothetical protein